MKKTVLLLALCPLGLSAMEQIKPPLWLSQADKALKNPVNFCATVFKIAKTHRTAEWYTKNSKYPLHEAIIQNEDLAVIKELVNTFNINVHQKNTRGIPPIFEIQYDSTDILDFLIQKGADINTKNNDGETPLHCCAMKKKVDYVKYLIAHGADIEAQTNIGETPLNCFCAYNTPLEIIRLLIKNGAEVNTQNEMNETPLHFASINGAIETVKLLIEQGALVNPAAFLTGTPLSWAVDTYLKTIDLTEQQKLLEVISCLIKNGAQLDQTLAYATKNNSTALIDFLTFVTNFDAVCNGTMTFENFAQQYFTLQNRTQTQVDKNIVDTCHLALSRGSYKLFKQISQNSLYKTRFDNIIAQETTSPITEIKPGSDRWYVRILAIASQYNNASLCRAILAKKPALWKVIPSNKITLEDSNLEADIKNLKQIWRKNKNMLFRRDVVNFALKQIVLNGQISLKDTEKIKLPPEIVSHILDYLG